MPAPYYYLRASSAVVLAAIAAALLLVVMMVHSGPALAVSTKAVSGTTIVVNTSEDESNTDGDCSLREAIEAADTNAAVDGCEAGSATERDAIHFSIGEEATIVLGSELPTITDASGLNINGLRSKITVSGNDSVRVLRVGEDAKLTIANLTVANGSTSNFGGGIANFDGTLEVIRSTFTGNSANAGGGISDFNGGTLEVTNSTFSGNSADHAGGGIASFHGTLEVTNSTFSENSAADFGGGIMNHFLLEVTNSTFSENSAGSEGGGIYNAFGPATLRNTIVANSTSGGNCHADHTPITDGGYNIEDDTTCGFSEANNSMPSTDPLLAESLADNGGPTKTIALKKGSPAINAIPEATNGCGTEITKDQRGVKRPQGSGCEVGAFEKKVRRR